MAKYNYIQVVMRRNVDNVTRTLYSYPAAGTDNDARWERTLVEPGAAIQRFLNATECYVMQSSRRGRYFSMITRNTSEPAGGYNMISLFVDENCALTGKQLLNSFSALRKIIADDNSLNDDAIDQALESAGVAEDPIQLPAWTYTAPDKNGITADAAYRTFMSIQELESIFSFPNQPEYDRYRCIIVVSATTSLRPGVKMDRITVPIRKQYTVVCPPGVKVSEQSVVHDGDRLEIIYTRDGFSPREETVTIGHPSPYLKYDGSTIRVRPASQCGIRFTRRFALMVSSAKGNDINGYTVSVNGRPVNTMEPYLDLTEIDLADGATVQIQAASNNYRQLKLEYQASDLLLKDSIELVLQPIEQCVTLRLDFGEGRIFEEYISIEKNTPEYNRLHSGNFHGFRAHRQVTQDNSEIYNVDVRFNGRPVAPNFDSFRNNEPLPASVDRTTAEHHAPVYENVSEENESDRPTVDTSLPTVDDNVKTYRDDTEKRSPLKWIAAVGVAVVLLVVALTIFLPRGEKLDVAPADPQPADSVTATAPTTEEPPHVSPLAGDDAADVEYLNTHSRWNVAEIKGETSKKLFAAIKNGDMEGVVNNDYFAVTGRCKNRRADDIADLLWKAYGSPVRASNAKALRAASRNGVIDLNSLYDNLMRKRPKDEEANMTPRPRR